MSDQSASPLLPGLSAALAALVRDVAPSLVSIRSARTRSTGFSWRPGLIVAAEDAIPDDGDLSVIAHDGASGSAHVVGRDPSTDVALLRVDRTDLPKAPPTAAAPMTGALALVVGAREGAASAGLGVVSFVGAAMAQFARRRHRCAHRTRRGACSRERRRSCSRRRRPGVRDGGIRPPAAHAGHSNDDNRPRR